METAWPSDRANSRLLGTAFIVLLLILMLSIAVFAQEVDNSGDDSTSDVTDSNQETTDNANTEDNNQETTEETNVGDETTEQNNNEETNDDSDTEDSNQETTDETTEQNNDEETTNNTSEEETSDENYNETTEEDNDEENINETSSEETDEESYNETTDGNDDENNDEYNSTEINSTDNNETENNETTDESEDNIEDEVYEGPIKMLVNRIITMLQRLDLIENKQKSDSEKVKLLESELANAREDIEYLKKTLQNDANFVSEGKLAEAESTPPKSIDISFSLPPFTIMKEGEAFPLDIIITNTGTNEILNLGIEVNAYPELDVVENSFTEISKLSSGETIVIRTNVRLNGNIKGNTIEVKVNSEEGIFAQKVEL